MKRTLTLFLAIILFASITDVQAQRNRIPQESKFVFMTSLAYATGAGDIQLANFDCHEALLPPTLDASQVLKTVRNKNFNVNVEQLIGYQFNNYFYMGVGTGIDFWQHTAFVPLYLNLSVNMMQTRVAPTAFLNLGWGFKWYISSRPEVATRVIHGTNQGPMGEAGLGLRIQLSDKGSLLIAGTYKLQYSKIRYSIVRDGEDDFSANLTNSIQPAFYHFGGVKVGIIY
mgnify:CR=1 FL=1